MPKASPNNPRPLPKLPKISREELERREALDPEAVPPLPGGPGSSEHSYIEAAIEELENLVSDITRIAVQLGMQPTQRPDFCQALEKLLLSSINEVQAATKEYLRTKS